MAPSLSQALHLGFRFNHSPLHAAVYYLPRLIAGEPLHESVARFVHNADVYACEPGALAARFLPVPSTDDRFFFTTRRRQKAGKASRAVRFAGPGSWTSQRSTDVLDGAGVKVGEMTKLRYKKGAVLTDWLTDEFSTCCSDGAVAGDRHRVLCKIYVSPRAHRIRRVLRATGASGARRLDPAGAAAMQEAGAAAARQAAVPQEDAGRCRRPGPSGGAAGRPRDARRAGAATAVCAASAAGGADADALRGTCLPHAAASSRTLLPATAVRPDTDASGGASAAHATACTTCGGLPAGAGARRTTRSDVHGGRSRG
ncbi:hypothetical protein ACP4OV_003273 [Aristida adscensionis]